jgi:hypothetical protein
MYPSLGDWNGPGSAFAMSRATEGFSATINVFATAPKIAPVRKHAGVKLPDSREWSAC